MNEDNEINYVSPADFDEPGTPEEDVKHKDELDLPILEEVVLEMAADIAKCSHTDALEATDDTAEMTLEQRWAIQRVIARKLEGYKLKVEAVIEGIKDKYDETGE